MATIDACAAHFAFTATPFTKTIPANKLFERSAHCEAVARIHYCINQAALGVIVGDTGAGKTVALRAATVGLDRTKHTLVYLSNPAARNGRTLRLAFTSARRLRGCQVKPTSAGATSALKVRSAWRRRPGLPCTEWSKELATICQPCSMTLSTTLSLRPW